jgi:hypothetical protein
MAATIIVTNETGAALVFTQLMVPNGQIDAGGQAQVSDWNYVEQILRDEELLAFITGDQALLDVNGTALTKQQSLAFLTAPTTPVKVSYGESSLAPTSDEDASLGYSIGSVWVTTLGAAYTCVDATPTAAVWTLQGGSAAPTTLKDPVDVQGYVGTRTVTEINALTPVVGDSVVAGSAGTPTAPGSDAVAIGDLVEYQGDTLGWQIIVTNSGGFPPSGTRALVHNETVTLYAPLTDGSDEGKIAAWGGASLTPTLSSPTDGDQVVVIGTGSVNLNRPYVFNGTVPSGTWELHAEATWDQSGLIPYDSQHWANHGFDTALSAGGVLTYGAGLVVNVSAGHGFINDATDKTAPPVLVGWDAGTTTIPADVISWIYITSGGVISDSTTEPSPKTNLVLGTAQGGATATALLSHARPSLLLQHRPNLGEFIEQAFGGLATEGLLVTENATALHLDVAAGTYFIAGDERDPTAQTDITWTYWYRDGAGGWTTVLAASAVNVTNYDDDTGTLATLPTNKWKKDTLFITDNGDGYEFHLVYAQTVFNTEAEARYANNPSPSLALFRYAARISGIVVQQGATNISTPQDEKPNAGQSDPTSAANTRVRTVFIPAQTSASLSASTFGRQVVVSVAANGGTNMTFVIPGEATSIVAANLLGMPTSGAAGAGKDIDFYTDYGGIGESPTTHQESDLVSTYDFTGLTGIISTIADLAGILTNAIGGDVVGLEIDHNSIGGAIQYLGLQLIYEVEV